MTRVPVVEHVLSVHIIKDLQIFLIVCCFIMANHWHLNGSICNSCWGEDRDFSVSSTGTDTTEEEQVTYDYLLTILLSTQTLLKSSRAYPVQLRTTLSRLLDKISTLNTILPYRPPSRNLINSVRCFKHTVESNVQLIAGIIVSTRSSLIDLKTATDSI